MKLSFKEKAGYGIGALGKDMACGIVNTFLLVYFTDVVGLAPMFVGVLFLAARIFDAANDPMGGWIIDNTKSKMGKFRPWILIGTLTNAVALVFLFYNPHIPGAGLYIYFSAVFILWDITYTFEDVGYWSMIPALAESEEERNTVSTIPRIFAAIGNVTVGTFTLFAIKMIAHVKPELDPTPEQRQTGFFWVAAIIAVIFIVTNVITVVFVKEKYSVKQEKKFKFKEIFTTILHNDQLIIIVISMVLYSFAINLTSTLALYYFRYDIGEEDLFSTFYMIAGVGQVLAMLLFPFVAKRLSRRRVYIVSATLPIVGYASLYLIGRYLGTNMPLLSVAGFVLFFGFGFSNVLTSVMLADAVDYGEYKLGYRSESIVFSMQPFMVKVAMGLSGLFTGIGLSLFGYVANQKQSETALVGIRILMFVLPIILLMISLFVYLKFYKLNGKFAQDVRDELASRRAQHE